MYTSCILSMNPTTTNTHREQPATRSGGPGLHIGGEQTTAARIGARWLRAASANGAGAKRPDASSAGRWRPKEGGTKRDPRVAHGEREDMWPPRDRGTQRRAMNWNASAGRWRPRGGDQSVVRGSRTASAKTWGLLRVEECSGDELIGMHPEGRHGAGSAAHEDLIFQWAGEMSVETPIMRWPGADEPLDAPGLVVLARFAGGCGRRGSSVAGACQFVSSAANKMLTAES